MAKYLTIHVPDDETFYVHWRGKSYDDFDEMVEDLYKHKAVRDWGLAYTADRLKADMITMKNHFIRKGYIYEEVEIG